MAFSTQCKFGSIRYLLAVCLMTASGCRVVEKTASLPVNAVEEAVPGVKRSQPDPGALQVQVLRFADSLSSQSVAALDEYARRNNTTEGRMAALSWKLALGSTAVSIATGENPTANLLDFVALTTLMRGSLEERAPQAVPRGALNAWLDVSRVMETNAWNLAQRFLMPDQQHQLRAAIDSWRKENPETAGSVFSPQELAPAIREAAQKQSQAGGIFGLVGLDPMAGLDPAIREVTRTRLFAERALFAAEHMPLLIHWQAELFSDQFLRQEQVTVALQSVDRLSRAAESASQTAALLPGEVVEERKAILTALDAQEGKLRDLSGQVGMTLGSAEKMSTSLNTTLTTFTALMKLFGVGQPSTTPPDTNSPPFNILDYAHTADRVALMALQLDTLIKDTSGTVDTPALDKRIASLSALADRARSDAKSVLHEAFVLVVVLLVVAFGLALAYRRLLPRTNTAAHSPS